MKISQSVRQQDENNKNIDEKLLKIVILHSRNSKNSLWHLFTHDFQKTKLLFWEGYCKILFEDGDYHQQICKFHESTSARSWEWFVSGMWMKLNELSAINATSERNGEEMLLGWSAQQHKVTRKQHQGQQFLSVWPSQHIFEITQSHSEDQRLPCTIPYFVKHAAHTNWLACLLW